LKEDRSSLTSKTDLPPRVHGNPVHLLKIQKDKYQKISGTNTQMWVLAGNQQRLTFEVGFS
jgi:hypothetical protein